MVISEYLRLHGPADEKDIQHLMNATGLPPASIRAAISYYDDLSHDGAAVRVCHGTSCMLAGADKLRNAIEAHTPCRTGYCLGYCDQSPAVLGPDDRVMVQCDPTEAANLLTAPAQCHMLPPIRCVARKPIVTSRIGRGSVAALTKATSAGVYEAIRRAIHEPPVLIIDEIERSGERGRGGAGFLTGAKWRMCASAKAQERFIIANGDEGDPGSFVDRVLMEFDPHALLEGLLLAGYAVGASRGIVFIRSEYPQAARAVQGAIDEARAAGILGHRVLNSAFSFDVTIFRGMGSYVCGEETALINAIEGFRGEVSLRPPYPAIEGLFGKPTVINNVETLVNVPWIISHGAEAYRAMGTNASPGTKAICLNHGFAKPGIVEVEFGTSLRDVIETHAGGGRRGQRIEAVILGGPMGSVLTSDQWDVPICTEAMNGKDIRLGHGGLVALLEGTDYASLLRHWLAFMKHESCGKCVPCRVGSQRSFELCSPSLTMNSLPDFLRILDLMESASLCGFGQLMPGPMRTLVGKFGDRIVDRTSPHGQPASKESADAQ